jgi:hypothetical protein
MTDHEYALWLALIIGMFGAMIMLYEWINRDCRATWKIKLQLLLHDRRKRRLARCKSALNDISTINGMDYKYREWAREALAALSSSNKGESE